MNASLTYKASHGSITLTMTRITSNRTVSSRHRHPTDLLGVHGSQNNKRLYAVYGKLVSRSLLTHARYPVWTLWITYLYHSRRAQSPHLPIEAMEIPRQQYPVITLVLECLVDDTHRVPFPMSSQALPPIAVSIGPLVLIHILVVLIASLPVLLVMDIREEHPPTLVLAALWVAFREADTLRERLLIPAVEAVKVDFMAAPVVTLAMDLLLEEDHMEVALLAVLLAHQVDPPFLHPDPPPQTMGAAEVAVEAVAVMEVEPHSLQPLTPHGP